LLKALTLYFSVPEKAFEKYAKSERIFSWYNLVSFLNIAYKARHAFNDENLMRSWCCLKKLSIINRLDNGRDKKYT